jgi:hypothetical protein
VTTGPILPTRDPGSPATSILSYIILLGGAATIGLAGYLVLVSYSNLPFWDGWMQISVVARGENPLSVAWLWSQYNQHRLFIPKLFLLADLRWFHATQVFLLACVFGIQLLHLLLLTWSMRVLGGWRGSLWRTGFGLAAFCLFCPSQWQNQTMGISGLCFDLPGLFATLSFIGLLLYWVRSAEPASGALWKYLLLSVAAALGGTLTLSNGNLLWPLLVGAALLLRLRLGAELSLAVAGSVSIAVYLHNYVRLPSVISSLETPTTSIKYVAAYFGSSWVRNNIHVAELAGLAGTIILLFVLLRLPSYIRSRRAFCVQLVLTLLFCFGTGLFTSMGRLVFGIGQAFSSRYQAFSLLFWCCLGLLLLGWAFSASQTRKGDFLLVQAILLAIMLFAASRATIPLARARLQGFQLNVAAVALVVDAPDKEQLQWADSQPDYVLSLVPYIRRQRLSVFFGPLPPLLGKPLDSVFSLASPDECAGRVESSTAVAGARQPTLRMTGWAWDSQHREAPSQIVATTNGVITGLGVVGDWRPAARETNPRITSNYTGFTGYVGDVRESIPVNLYAILPGRPATACLIAALPQGSHSAQ